MSETRASVTKLDPQARAAAEAREWLIRLHDGENSAADPHALARWRGKSTAHEQAFDEAQHAWVLLGALGSNAAAVEASLPAPRIRGRRWITALAASIVLLIAASAALILPPHALEIWRADVHTAPGEIRRIALADGSVLTLNGGTAVSYHVDAGRREVHLITGEAFFAVAHDASRPFVVRAGPAHIRDIGTKFDVEKLDDRVAVTVTEGSVAAGLDDDAVDVHVRPSQRLVWYGTAETPVVAADIDEVLAWQRGQLVFKSRPLGEVLATLARYRTGRIVVLGSDVAARDVTGVFDAAHPDAVLDAIQRNLAVSVVRVTPYLTIVR
jgi:transmembrane sensor